LYFINNLLISFNTIETLAWNSIHLTPLTSFHGFTVVSAFSVTARVQQFHQRCKVFDGRPICFEIIAFH